MMKSKIWSCAWIKNKQKDTKVIRYVNLIISLKSHKCRIRGLANKNLVFNDRHRQEIQGWLDDKTKQRAYFWAYVAKIDRHQRRREWDCTPFGCRECSVEVILLLLLFRKNNFLKSKAKNYKIYGEIYFTGWWGINCSMKNRLRTPDLEKNPQNIIWLYKA